MHWQASLASQTPFRKKGMGSGCTASVLVRRGVNGMRDVLFPRPRMTCAHIRVDGEDKELLKGGSVVMIST